MASQFIKNTIQTLLDWTNISNYSSADTLSFACEKHIEDKSKELERKQEEQLKQEQKIESCAEITENARKMLETANNDLQKEIDAYKINFRILRDAINLVLQSQNEKNESISSLSELSKMVGNFDTDNFQRNSKKYDGSAKNAEKVFSEALQCQERAVDQLKSIEFDRDNIERHIQEIKAIQEQLRQKMERCKETKKTKDE
jgi:hypothetical protein